MSGPIGSAFRSFWHTMTSYDRHSSYDSPYKTGRHVPLNQGGIDGLTSIATASESRADIPSAYHDEALRSPSSALNSAGARGSQSLPSSPGPGRPYSPGLRSLSARASGGDGDGFEMQSPAGEIPMQSFQDGLPPAPPVSHSWGRIDKWAEENYPELFDQLCEGCTTNDLNELEHQLDCSLPQDVRESLQVHDGQERPGNPTGIIFSSMLLDCEEMVQEWENWRKVNLEFLAEASSPKPSAPSKAHGGSSQASSSKEPPSPARSSSSTWRQDLLARQNSIPPNAVQKAYAHPAWIPLARDWGGNNLAVDLSPGPAGQWGQVIIFGRDYDTKYVVARSWGAFMAIVADDLNSGKWFVDEETNELKLREFKKARVEPPYLDILRWRIDQKYGRRMAKRKSAAPTIAPSPTGPTSPYASPADPSPNSESRGRSMQRLSLASPVTSPIRPGFGKASPLARVAEENPPSVASTGADGNSSIAANLEKLVEVETPRHSDDGNNGNNDKSQRPAALTNGDPPANQPGTSATTPTSSTSTAAASSTAPADELTESTERANGKQPTVVEEEEEAMKTIEI